MSRLSIRNSSHSQTKNCTFLDFGYKSSRAGDEHQFPPEADHGGGESPLDSQEVTGEAVTEKSFILSGDEHQFPPEAGACITFQMPISGDELRWRRIAA